MKKTVVELDLIGYSDKARELQEHLAVVYCETSFTNRSFPKNAMFSKR